MKTLAIETSCDDTSVGIIKYEENTYTVDTLLAYSQIDDHQKYWWVVPEVASRLHSEKIIAVIEKIGWDKIADVDTISVTTHPWLPWSLVVGKAIGVMLAEHFQKPVKEVNHIYGHIFSLLLERKETDITYPLVVLTASGWHNDIYKVIKEGEHTFTITRIGKTLDDASGECFDKIARMLWWPYPWWWWIGEQAMKWRPGKITVPRIRLSADKFDFSFSWMKGHMSNYLKKNPNSSEQDKADIAYEFQEAMIEVLAKKLVKAAKAYTAATIGIAGGVSCNERLREYLITYAQEKIPEAACIRPMKKIYSTDNAAMIGVAGIIGDLGKITRHEETDDTVK